MPSDPVFIAFQLAILILSIVIHEVAHGYAANMLGDPTARLSGRLTLNPIPHIDLIGSVVVPGLLLLQSVNGGAPFLFGWAKPVPYNPYNLRNKRWGEAIVAFAGPGTNLLLAIVFGLIVRFSIGTLPDAFVIFALLITKTNLFLGLFNLIPVPPLDGYTTLRGLLPYKAGMVLRDFENRIRSGGIASLILILIVFSVFFAGPFSLLVSYIFALLVGS